MKESIVITGAAGNLGRKITASLLDAGFTIKATLGPNDDPEFLVHDQLETEAVNLLDQTASKAYIDRIADVQDEQVSTLICLVGGFHKAGIMDTTWEDIQKMISLDFASAYNVVQPLVAHHKSKNKPLQLIFIGSRPALNPEEGKEFMAYALAKSLLLKLADFINVDTNETGIKASVIVPSTLDTPGTRSAMPDEDPAMWVPPLEVANTIKFILSDAGKMMRNPLYKIYNRA